MKGIIILILYLFSLVSLFGKDLPYRIYNTHNGLPQIQVTAVYQDNYGYVWVGTKAGLAQFNGEHFHQYLGNEYIYSIDSDALGNVFVKASSGVYKFDGAQFRLMNSINEPFQLMVADSCYFIYSKDWIEHYCNDTLVEQYQVGVDFSVGGVESVVYDPKLKLLYCTDFVSNEVFRIKANKLLKIYTAPKGWKVNVGRLSHNIPVILLNNENEVKCLSLPNGELLFTFRYANNEIKNVKVNSLPVQSYLLNYMYDYFLLDSATNRANKLQLDFIKAPYPVIIDKDNQLWAGSDNGLYQIWEDPFEVYPESFMKDFWTLIQSDEGNLYGAAFKQGLYLLDMERKAKKEITATGFYNHKETDYYYGASKDKNGNLYFPTHYGLVKYNQKQTIKLNTGIVLVTCYDAFSDRIIFGQENGLGFLDVNGQIEYIKDETKSKIKSHPSAIEFSGDTLIWIGTGRSLAVYDRKKNTFFNSEELFADGPTAGIISMAKDHKDNIWMGGREGLWIFDSGEKKFKKVPLLHSGYITAIMAYSEDKLLLGTTRELMVFKLDEYLNNEKLIIKTYNFRNGLLAQEIAQNGFIKWDDKVLFPSTTNTTAINPEQVRFYSEFFNVEITHYNNTPITYAMRKLGQPLLLSNHENDLELDFETVGFGLPTMPEYRYRLKGVNKDWSEWSRQNYAVYHNLSSGKYTFEVMVKPAFVSGIEDFKTSSINIVVQLPFYKEPHFYKYAFFVLLLLGLIIAYISRSRYLFKVKAIEQERKKRYLEIASLQANLNPHFIFNLLASVQNLVTQHKPELANQYIIKFSRLIRAYMEATIKSSQVMDQSQEKNEISIKDEVDLLKMYIEFEQIKYRAKAFDYELEVSDPDLLNKTIPPMIIQPFVENAIKHGLYPANKDGKLVIQITSDHEALICTITDNGIGRKKSEELKKDSIKVYESRGIELIQKRIDILNELGYNIRIRYEDPDLGGTKVIITFN
ncbi:sensor histidine kinase [Carboxylicivirga linearis]|uniref:Histidine kinase n=1 Tax=Carboxylicivirga linearis TaxID=1628157 RepID=A0ABS5JYF6_9BACT|nr:histidine kinase [Carboxylicivirga linearis]MBS2099932.1 histidine kinase [Carboxylicivirga linearis]